VNGAARCRATCADILRHPWLKQEGHGMDKPLDNVVLTRMKNFAAMNKLKKTALMVVGSCLSAEEIAGMKRLFKTIDEDNSGTITVKELQARATCAWSLSAMFASALAGCT
jgi:calcium-dependent protein kinase